MASPRQEKTMRRGIVILAALLIVVLAISVVLAVMHRGPFEQSASPPAATPAVPVVAGVVDQHDVPIYLTGVGTVIAYNTVVVRSQIQGQIRQHRLHRRADREGRRPARANRPASLPGAARPDDRQPRSRSGPTRECPGQSRSLQPTAGQGLCYAATGRHPEGASGAAAERHQVRRGAHRSRQRCSSAIPA